jgi:hypothetical protein
MILVWEQVGQTNNLIQFFPGGGSSHTNPSLSFFVASS